MDNKTLETIAGGKLRGIAEVYECVYLILPSHQAFIARQWTKDAMEQLKERKEENLTKTTKQ